MTDNFESDSENIPAIPALATVSLPPACDTLPVNAKAPAPVEAVSDAHAEGCLSSKDCIVSGIACLTRLRGEECVGDLRRRHSL